MIFLSNSVFGFDTAKALALTQQVLVFLKDPRFIDEVAKLAESMLDADPEKIQDDDRKYFWDEGSYYEVFYTKGSFLILCNRQDVICPPKTPSATRSNTPVDRGQRLFADEEESSSSEDEDESSSSVGEGDSCSEGDSCAEGDSCVESDNSEYSGLLNHMGEVVEGSDTEEEGTSSASREEISRYYYGWKFVSDGKNLIKSREIMTEQDADEYCLSNPQALFRFKCSACKKKDIDEHISFKADSDENQLYIVFTRRLSSRVFVDFHISIGNALFNDPSELIDENSEFDGLGSDSITAEDIAAFIEQYEQNYNPDFPEINAHLLSFLGSGISSQVTWPLYFLRSMVLKRIHRTCKCQAEVEKVIASARANIMLMNLAGIPIAPVSYLYVYNVRRRDYVIYAIQPKYAREQFADHVLADPAVPWGDKKKIIDTIIDYMEKCEGPNPLNPTGDPEQGFVFTVDPNFPNYCLIKGQWMLADMSPFFFAVNDEFAIGNHYILNLENNFYHHAKTLCTNPVRRYVFFLGMIYREYHKHKKQCYSYTDVDAKDEEAEMKASIWHEIYEYAVTQVFSLPQVRHELCVIIDQAQSYIPYVCQLPSFRFEFIDFCLEQLESKGYKVSKGYYSRVNRPLCEFMDNGSLIAKAASIQDLWDIGACFGTKINERVEKRKREKGKKKKDYDSGGRVKSEIYRLHGPLDSQEYKVFVENTLSMQYHAIPFTTPESSFLQSVAKGVLRFAFPGESEECVLGKLELALYPKLASSQVDRWSVPERIFFPSCDHEEDIIPILLGVLRDLSGIKCRVMVVYPNSQMRPESILYQFNSEIKNLVDVRRFYKVEDIKREARQESTIVLASHHTGPPVFFRESSPWACLSIAGLYVNSSDEPELSDSNILDTKGVIYQAAGFYPDLIPLRFVNEYSVCISNMYRLSGLVSVDKTIRYQRDIRGAITDYLRSIPLGIAGVLRRVPKSMQLQCYHHEAGSQLYMHVLVIALMDYLFEMYSGIEAYRTVVLIQPNLKYGQNVSSYAYWKFYRQVEQQLVGRYFKYHASAQEIVSLLQRPGTIVFFSNAFVSKSGHYILPGEEAECAGWWWVHNSGCLYYRRAPDYNNSTKLLNYSPVKRPRKKKRLKKIKAGQHPYRSPFRSLENDRRLNGHHVKPCASLQ
ncbi:hypothetical protein [Spongorhabdus nitratireducens]